MKYHGGENQVQFYSKNKVQRKYIDENIRRKDN